jgi:hypothetical protein
MLSRRTAVLVSLLTGVALELGVGLVTGRSEAWDSGLFWTIGLPMALVVAAVVGFLSKGRYWVWTLLIVPGQVLAMMIRNQEIGTLWPLTLILSAILSTPFVCAAFIGSRFRKATPSSH